MQVSSLNEVKIYSLSAGRSLPEVSEEPLPRGRPAAGRAALAARREGAEARCDPSSCWPPCCENIWGDVSS